MLRRSRLRGIERIIRRPTQFIAFRINFGGNSRVCSKFELFLKLADVIWQNFLKPISCTNLPSDDDMRNVIDGRMQNIVTPWPGSVGHTINMQSTMSPASGIVNNASSASKENGSLPKTTTNPTLTPNYDTARLAVLAVYPFTMFLGFLSNHPPDSYFARKDNLINVLFLKFAWAWTSLAFFAHVARIPQKMGPTARYAVATVWWYLVTQWCFGPPIMDKVDLRSS